MSGTSPDERVCTDERAHERLHDLVTTQLHVKHRLGVVNLLIRHFGTRTVSLALRFGDVVYQTTLKRTVENLLLMVYKRLDALMLQLTDCTNPEIHDLLVFIGHFLILQPLKDVVFGVLIEETQQQVARLLKRQNAKLVRILNVHDLVADIIMTSMR